MGTGNSSVNGQPAAKTSLCPWSHGQVPQAGALPTPEQIEAARAGGCPVDHSSWFSKRQTQTPTQTQTHAATTAAVSPPPVAVAASSAPAQPAIGGCPVPHEQRTMEALRLAAAPVEMKDGCTSESLAKESIVGDNFPDSNPLPGQRMVGPI
jgi:hypothetical protein